MQTNNCSSWSATRQPSGKKRSRCVPSTRWTDSIAKGFKKANKI